MSRSRWSVMYVVMITCCCLLGLGCGAAEEAAEPDAAVEPEATEPEATASAADVESSEPTIYFVEPADGDTVPTLFTATFAADNFTIEPVGEGEVHEGMGHFHIGLDTECLAAGIVIPTADPWIHFGDGSNQIELEMAPGEHTLTIQIGDGEHRTLEDEGLCTSISITVEEEEAAEE